MLPWRLAGGCRGGRLLLPWRLAGRWCGSWLDVGVEAGWELPRRLAGSSHPCVGLFCLSVLPVRNQKKNLSKII